MCSASTLRSAAVLVALFATAAAGAQEALERKLSAIVAGVPRGTQVGVMVGDARGTPLFEYNADVAMKPASVMKLLVTSAALEHLGHDFVFETRVYLAGDELWVIGSGDPGIGDERIAQRRGESINATFDDWASTLRAAGVSTLRTLALDDSIYERVERHADWPADQATAWYQAPVGAFNLNDNCLDARVDIRGAEAVLTLQPPLPAQFWQNNLRVSRQHRPTVKRDANSDIFRFEGSVSKNHAFGPISALRSTVFFGQALRKALETRGITVTGEVVRRTIPAAALANARLVATHRTRLEEVVWRANTFSQNLFADALLKALGAYSSNGQRSGTVGSWGSGEQVLRATLGRMGVDLGGATVRDGSGLSHENRVTARQLVRLLQAMRNHRCADIFRGSLAEPGEEGTLRRKFREPALRGRLLAKTGTIRGVSALAGYATASDGSELSFAVLVNGDNRGEITMQVARALLTAKP